MIKISIFLLSFSVIGCTTTKSIKKTELSKNDQNSVATVVAVDTNKTDTFSYIKTNIINRKNQYSSKPLKNLLEDLPYTVESYMMGTGRLRSVSPYIVLSFKSSSNTGNAILEKGHPTLLNIVWQDPLPTDSIYLLRSKSGGAWLDAEKNYFGRQIVKDLILSYDK